MDTIKNLALQSRRFLFAIGFAMFLISGCTPAGPRALLRGEKLIEHGKYAQALEILTNAAPLLKTNAHYWNYLGLAYHYSGSVTDAEMAYHRALALDRDLSEARYNLGCLWLEQNKPDLARTELTAFTLRRGNSTEGFLKLGAAQWAASPAAAEKSFQDALHLNSQSAEALNGVGLVRFQQKRYSDAQRFFASALRQRPDYAPAMLNLAILAQHSKDYSGALKQYRQYLALKSRPANADAVAAVTRQLEQDLNPPPAPPAPVTNPPTATLAPAKEQGNKAAHATTNVSYANTKPSTGAVVSNVTPPKSPTSTPISNAAPTNSVKAPVVSPKAASEVAADHAAKESSSEPVPVPAVPRYHYRSPRKPSAGNRANAQRLFAQGDHAQEAHRLPDAANAYKSAAQLDPAFFEAHYNLGLVATETGNLPLALASYENALAVVPDSLDARYNFALVLKQAGYFIDAENELEKLLSKYPNEARAHLALANLCAQKLQDNPRARQHYVKVLDLEPQHPQADAIRHWVTEHPL